MLELLAPKETLGFPKEMVIGVKQMQPLIDMTSLGASTITRRGQGQLCCYCVARAPIFRLFRVVSVRSIELAHASRRPRAKL